MNKQEIFELMDRFDAGRAISLRLVSGDFTLELTKAAPGVAAVPIQAAAPAGPAVSAPVPAAPEEEGGVITAPVVGTFYAAPSPGAEPFVRPGQRVEKGQTVCILEAMKMMSEVPAPCDCVIEEVLAATGDLVGYGQPLFRIREL